MEDKIGELEAVLRSSKAYAAILFGSYARGEDYNDIDVTVFTEDAADIIELKEDLAENFEEYRKKTSLAKV